MTAEPKLALVISCEHASNAIPPRLAGLFPDAAILASHRGWDLGAAGLAESLGEQLGTAPILAPVSRLLADANRSAHNYRVHAPAVRALPKSERAAIIKDWHRPHQDRVAQAVADALTHAPRILHIGCHSFTPELDGQRRNADVGLQYDPKHSREQSLCIHWQKAIVRATGLRVRRNYPYTGYADGLTTILRRRFGAPYLGIELELNQALLQRGAFPPALLRQVASSVTGILEGHADDPGDR